MSGRPMSRMTTLDARRVASAMSRPSRPVVAVSTTWRSSSSSRRSRRTEARVVLDDEQMHVRQPTPFGSRDDGELPAVPVDGSRAAGAAGAAGRRRCRSARPNATPDLDVEPVARRHVARRRLPAWYVVEASVATSTVWPVAVLIVRRVAVDGRRPCR